MTKSPIKVSPRLAVIVGLALVTVAITVTGAVQRLSSVAGTALQSGVVGNAAPAVDAIVPSDAPGSGSVALPAAGFTLNEGATRALYVRGTVSDPNGCEDIAGVAVTAYRPGVAYGGTDGMDATGVLGQGGSFTSGTANFDGISANGLQGPHDVAIDLVGRRLFVADYTNHRVLEYDLNADGTPIDTTADHVLGQADFSHNSANRGSVNADAGTMNTPVGLFWDAANARLFVSDNNNHRILAFDLAAGLTDGMPANNVLGQANFVSKLANRGGANPAADTMKYPLDMDIDYAGGRLFVADQSNRRVLAFNLADGLTDGESAMAELGQVDFSVGLSNRGASPAADTFNGVSSLAWDAASSRLFVSDRTNYRVLVYDLTSGLTNGMPASHVLGQADFVSVAANRGGSPAANTMHLPTGLAWDPAASRLFVADYNNNRILAFDLASGITDGMPASHVLGQADFSGVLANRDGSLNPTADTSSNPSGLLLDQTHKRLYAIDRGNHRVLWFNLDAGSACAPDVNDCYVASVAKAALVGCTGAGDTDATFETSVPVANFADPTDAGSPHADQAWLAHVVATDVAGLPASLAADFEVQSLAAFSVAPSLMDYGTIALGATSTQQAITFTNTGNRAVNSNVRADGDMHSSLAGFADIASTQSHYSVAQGTAWSAGTAIGTGDSDVPLALPQQQADGGPAPTAPAYFYLKLPTSGIRGTYTNTLFFTAYAP